ncbi:hypothetical protein ACJVC5_14495 [Peredibacter sp. HCB2-198]|uniref:hypothetical protein n=1 Tax=Peredibacter sp. HCB2-198 TaxID=3383025 RepID=UPI0038B6267E
MKKVILGLALTASAFSAFAQDINFGAQERWLAQNGGFTCGGAANTATQAVPQEFKNKAIIFTYMTTDYTLDNGKFVASYYEKGTECRYNLVGQADNVNMVFTKTDSTAYSINGSPVANCAEGKAYLDSLFAAPTKYFYKHGTMALQVAVTDAAAVCGEGATHVGIFFKKAAKTKID